MTSGDRVWFARVPWWQVRRKRNPVPPVDVAGVVMYAAPFDRDRVVLRVLHAHHPPLRSRVVTVLRSNLRARVEEAPIDLVVTAEQRTDAGRT